jgi:N-acetylneuraminate lyase
MIQQRLSGLIAAPFTAMHEDGSIDLDTIEKQAKLLIGNGVKGAFVCGTTGEGMSLTVEERMKIAERWQEVVCGGLAVIVHAGHTCLSDSRTLSVHAQEIGAYAVAAMAPFFFKPASVEDLVSFCAEIASAAPELPFYYYHIPAMTGVNFPMVDFLRVASDNIPTLAGIKFSYEDLMDLARCLNLEGGRFSILFGRDEILLAGLSLGATGAVGSTYNYAAPLYHRIIDAYNAGDMDTAQKEQARSQDMVALLHKYGGATGKAIMKIIGLDCGGARPPLRNLSKEQYDELANDLERIGFFDYCSKE